MRIFKTAAFHKWAGKEYLSDAWLRDAVNEMQQGLVGVELGGAVYKKRVALAGRGKSGGARILLIFKQGKHVFYIYGFAKNQRSNIKQKELKALKLLAKQLLSYDALYINRAISAGELIEVDCDG